MRRAVVIASAEAGYGPPPGPHRQSVDAWWEAARAAIAELGPVRVDAIALSGTMENLIAVDAEGRPVHDAILYSDPCGAAALESLAPTLAAIRAGDILGNPPEPLMTAFKLRWLQTHEPGRAKQARWFLPGAKDALALRLTGRAVTDPVTATTSGLMDLRKRRLEPGACRGPRKRPPPSFPRFSRPTATVGIGRARGRRRSRSRRFIAHPRHQRLRRRRRHHARLPLPRRRRHQPLPRHQRLGCPNRCGSRPRTEPGRLSPCPSS